MNKVNISGPFNYIKLVNNDNKIVRIFFDRHELLHNQKKCSDYNALTIDNYFRKLFAETTILYDFFMEAMTTFPISNYNNNNPYIYEMRKLFKNLYNNHGKMDNIRLHYTDIRSTILFHSKLTNIGNINIDDLISLKAAFLDLRRELEHINITNKKVVNGEIPIPRNISLLDINYYNMGDVDRAYTIVANKLLCKYDDNNNKKNIANYFDTFYTKKSIIIINYIEKFLTKISEYIKRQSDDSLHTAVVSDGDVNYTYVTYGEDIHTKNDTRHEIIGYITRIREYIDIISSVYSDTFFLRRLIDKPYINNSIIYSGGFHCAVYIWFLVKYYDYHIDEYFYINPNIIKSKNIKKDTESYIKKSNDPYDLLNVFIQDKPSQCVTITDLPR